MKKITFLIALLLLFLTSSPVNAHSGRTDSSGGHNCNVGACAGTYHYHNSGYTAPVPSSQVSPDSSSKNSSSQFLGWTSAAVIAYLIYKSRKNKKLEKNGGDKK